MHKVHSYTLFNDNSNAKSRLPFRVPWLYYYVAACSGEKQEDRSTRIKFYSYADAATATAVAAAIAERLIMYIILHKIILNAVNVRGTI